jgi:hypothetical protein
MIQTDSFNAYIEEYPAASCRESPGKDLIYLIRSLTPQQATGNALAASVQNLGYLDI